MLKQTVDVQLTQQRDQVLKEFSLDNKDGALARLVGELSTKHGDLTKDLQTRIDVVVKEFSLNEENSALSRLVQNVDRAQRTITNEFSLDNETSALSRLKRELLELLAATEKKNQAFQEDVKVSLARIVTTRQEIEQSTRHGKLFEEAMFEFVAREAQHAGDVATPIGNATGLIKNCKVGDCVVELGPDSAAPGSKIVIEAKEESRRHARRGPAGNRSRPQEPRRRLGPVRVLAEDGPSRARTVPALRQRFRRHLGRRESGERRVPQGRPDRGPGPLLPRPTQDGAAAVADFEAIERAILEIEKRAGNLEEVRKSAETIQSSSTKILDRVRIDREALEKQVTQLREKVGDLRDAMQAQP